MFSNLPKTPQLSPLCGIQTQVCFIPNLSMFHLNKNRKMHLLSIYYVLRPLGLLRHSPVGEIKTNAVPYNIRHNVLWNVNPAGQGL